MKNNVLRAASLLLSVALTAVIFIGCRASDNDTNAGGNGQYSNQIPGGVGNVSAETLEALSQSGEISVYSFADAAAERDEESEFDTYFSEVYGGSIIRKYIEWEKWENTFITNFAADDAPDVISLFSKLWPKAASREFVFSKAELTEMGIVGLDHPAIAATDDMSERNFSFANNVYGLYTSSVSPVVMVVNDDLLKVCGVKKMPLEYYNEGQWNWDNFLKICAQVCSIDTDGTEGPDYAGYYGWDTNYLVASNGGEIIKLNDDGTVKANFSDIKVQNGLQMVRDMYGTYKYSSTKDSNFKGGKVAMFAEQHYNVAKQINNAGDGLTFNYSVVPLPRGTDNDDGYCMGGADSYTVVSSSKNPQGAVNYMIAMSAFSKLNNELDPDYDLEKFLDDDGITMLNDLRQKVKQPPFKGVGNVNSGQWDFWRAVRDSQQTVNEIIGTFEPWFAAQCQSENMYNN